NRTPRLRLSSPASARSFSDATCTHLLLLEGGHNEPPRDYMGRAIHRRARLSPTATPDRRGGPARQTGSTASEDRHGGPARQTYTADWHGGLARLARQTGSTASAD